MVANGGSFPHDEVDSLKPPGWPGYPHILDGFSANLCPFLQGTPLRQIASLICAQRNRRVRIESYTENRRSGRKMKTQAIVVATVMSVLGHYANAGGMCSSRDGTQYCTCDYDKRCV